MNMANVFPPFKIDIAGAFCVPRALKDVREQYQNGQVSRQILQAVEDAEVRSLVERLELGGMKVVSDGGFRSRDFLESWEGICSKDGRPFSEGSPLEITGRLSLLRHPILEEFAFLDSIVDGGVMKKQHIPSPAEVMTQIIQRVERTQIETVYSDIRLLTDDIASCYKFLLTKLYDAGCRYVQFDGVHSVIMEDTIRLNNRVLRERPAGMYVAFHAPTDMLVQLHGADAYFLNYDCGACDRNRLLWFIHEKEAVFGFGNHPNSAAFDNSILRANFADKNGMFNLNENNRIVMAYHPSDMRMGVNGMCGQVRSVGLDPTDGKVYIFVGKSRKIMKLLHWERGGFAMYYKRLEQGRFHPRIFLRQGIGFRSLRWDELVLLMEGISPKVVRRLRYEKDEKDGSAEAKTVPKNWLFR